MRIAVTLAALLLALPSSGCVAAAAAGAGVGYYFYDRNETVQDFEVDFDAAWDASMAAVEEFADLSEVTSHERGDTSGAIVGEHYKVRVEQHPGSKVRVIVRVGTFDTAENRRVAGLVMESIAGRLEG